jgi:hypothetical protein
MAPALQASAEPGGVADARRRAVQLGLEFMAGRMGLAPSVLSGLAAEAGEPGRPWIEYAHTPHLFHLGTARVMREAARHAKSSDGMLVYFLNDHLPARELAESRYLPLSVSGHEVANPPSFALTAPQGKRGMTRVAPPSAGTISRFAARWVEIEPPLRSAIEGIVGRLSDAAAATADHAAFLCRVMLEATQTMPLCVPTSAVMGAFPEWSARMTAEGRLWHHCAVCGYRLGRAGAAPSPACPTCAATDRPMIVPDVVARQTVANTCGLALRVCGRHKPYQDESDGLSQRFEVPPPPRLRVTGAARVRGRSGKLVDRVNLLQWIACGGAVESLDGADAAGDVIVDAPPGLR